jgi:ribonuclease P protein component
VTARQKRRRLSRSAEFDRVYRHGRSAASRALVVYAFPRSGGKGEEVERLNGSLEVSPRLGVSVGRRVGGAVVRNRIKRMLREAFWGLSDAPPPGRDFVIVARADARQLAEAEGLEALKRELGDLLRELEERESDEARG